MNKIILASKSKVRKKILENNGIFCEVQPSNVDEEPVKESLIKEGASPEIVSKNLAELKANKVSNSNPEKIVLGADSVIDLENNIVSKPKDRLEAMEILKKLNVDNVINISSVTGENITYLIRELQNFILKMKNKKNIKAQSQKIISWSP